jgi:hypothetical protein
LLLCTLIGKQGSAGLTPTRQRDVITLPSTYVRASSLQHLFRGV